MQFGLFTWFNPLPGQSEAESFAWGFQEIETAEAMGWDTVWLPQQRFSGSLILSASPFVMATAAVARIKRIKIGLAIHTLGLNTGKNEDPRVSRYAALWPSDPLETAEAVATIDQVSRGRFIYGAGGYTAGDPQRQRNFYEFLEVMQLAWKDGPFPGYEGEFYRHPPNPGVAPKPYSRRIPISVAADNQKSFPKIGEKGYQLLIGAGTSHNPRGESAMIEDVKRYRESWKAAGHPGEPQITVRIPTHVAETKERALQDVEETMKLAWERALNKMLPQAAPGTPSAQSAERMNLFGTAEEAIERIHRLRETMGATEIMFETNYWGRIPTERVLNSMRLITEKVIPKFA
ncbi:MAG: LLM class flavin-dependent oxidoreductase [Chloroflexi bacterium]|nr:LLM class flavin-dependent oxidoreductase [Chloroflexota bacterium]